MDWLLNARSQSFLELPPTVSMLESWNDSSQRPLQLGLRR